MLLQVLFILIYVFDNEYFLLMIRIILCRDIVLLIDHLSCVIQADTYSIHRSIDFGNMKILMNLFLNVI